MNNEKTDSTTPGEPSHSTFQLGTIVLQVRDDIDVLVREYGGQPTYILEDELTSKYYRIGAAEYTFLSLLDGRNSFATALGRTAAIMKQDALTEDRAAAFCKWLVQNGLASTEQSRSIARLDELAQQGEAQRRRGRWSILTQRFPLFYPRKSIEFLGRAFGWMFGGVFALLWLGLVIAGVTAIVFDWDRFRQASATIISRDNWIWLIATWLVLKVVHECAHAVACRRFGGTVREVGVLFIVFVPLPYVDVSSAWRFASKWQRIVTSAAGMMAEMAIAAIAALVWSQSSTGLVSQNAINVIFSAGVVTLLFNANPLMRFDGYYILTDLLELPNLYTHGRHALLQIGRRWGLGLKSIPQEFPEGHRGTILAYGFAAFIWRIFICIGLVLAADALFYGLGTLIALLAVAGWLLLPIVKLLRFVIFGSKTEQPSRVKFATWVAVLLAIGFALNQWVPWYSSTTAPIVVDYYPQTELRTPVSGFVDDVLVKDGQQVCEGQVLFRLRNDELVTELEELKYDITLARQRMNVFLDRKQIASLQVEQDMIEALEKRWQELQQQISQLVVKAPNDGVVLDGDVSRLRGTYVPAGKLLVQLGTSNGTEVLAMIDQKNEEFFRREIGHDVEIHIDGTGVKWLRATLVHVSPRTTRTVPHPALAANAGGPLEVRTTNRNEQDSNETTTRYELLHPHFLSRVNFDSNQSSCRPGMTGTLAFFSRDGTVGHHVQRIIRTWWNDRKSAIARQLYKR